MAKRQTSAALCREIYYLHYHHLSYTPTPALSRQHLLFPVGTTNSSCMAVIRLLDKDIPYSFGQVSSIPMSGSTQAKGFRGSR